MEGDLSEAWRKHEQLKLKSAMKKLRSTLTYKIRPEDKEHPYGESLTVPDDGYTIAELLEKHQQGLALGIKRLGEFDIEDDDEFEGVDMEKLQQLEETERRELIGEKLEKKERFDKHAEKVKKASDEAKKRENDAKKEEKKE